MAAALLGVVATAVGTMIWTTDAADVRFVELPAGRAAAAPGAAASPTARPPSSRVRARASRPEHVALVGAVATPEPVVRRVRVVDAEGRPVGGVRVKSGAEGCHANLVTGDDGVALLETEPDASTTVEIDDGWSRRDVQLTGALTVVAVEFPTLEVDVIDATTGRRVVPGRMTVRTWHGATLREVVIDAGDAGTSLRTLHVPLAWSRKGDVTVSVVPPVGFGAVERLQWEGPVAAQAKRARFVFTVYPETTRVVRGVDDQGQPVCGGLSASVTLAAEHGSEIGYWHGLTDTAQSDGGATVRISGLPALPANVISVELSREPADDGTNGWRGAISGLALALPAIEEPIDVLVRPWDGGFACSGTRCGGCGCVVRRRGGSESLAVNVVRRDGTPASHVTVRVGPASGETDAGGRAVLGNCRIGRAVAVASAHGFLPAVRAVDVGRDTEIVLRESEARAVIVTVVDRDGNPVPGARVLARSESVPGPDGGDVPTGVTVAQLLGDEELLTPRTDPSGRVSLELPVGAIEFDVALAGARAKATSSEDRVSIVLLPPVSTSDDE